MNDWYGTIGILLLLTALAGVTVAAGLVGLRSLRLAIRETGVTLALASSMDGRHALTLAWGLRRAAHRMLRTLGTVEDDPALRTVLKVNLRHFTGKELSGLLRRIRTLVVTGDNDRVRALNRQLKTYSARRAKVKDGTERRYLDDSIAYLEQQMEESRRTSRAWVGIIRKLEETRGAMKALERDIALDGLAHDLPLSHFQRRLHEISTHIHDVQLAHLELDASR